MITVIIDCTACPVRELHCGDCMVTALLEPRTADLAKMQSDGTLGDVITHEMGHVLGIGTLWERMGLLKDAGENTVRSSTGMRCCART